jgi:hypothetical protein
MEITKSHTFTINLPNVSLNKEDELVFKLSVNVVNNSSFTASFNPSSLGNISVSSNSPSTGYNKIPCRFVETGSNNNEVVFKPNISSIYGGNYIFVPNPVDETTPSDLYLRYGDVDYPFVINNYDLLIIYLSDGSYVEYNIINTYIDVDDKIHVVLDQSISLTIQENISQNNFNHFLFLSRVKDETSSYVIYKKQPGKTSYGFIIPNNLHPDVLANIDVITKEVKQKLLDEQQTIEINTIDTLNGGNF